MFIDPLRTFISSRRRDIDASKIHFQHLVKKLNDCQDKFPDNLDSDDCLENVSQKILTKI